MLFKRSLLSFAVFFAPVLLAADVVEQVENQLFYKQKIERQGWELLTEAEQKQFEAARDEALRIVAIDFVRWIKISADTSISIGEQKELFQKLGSLSALNCKSPCEICRDSPNGCIHSKSAGSLGATVALIPQKALNGKNRGEIALEALSGATPEFLNIAGTPAQKKKRKSAAIKHFQGIRSTLEATLSRCPGPYEQSTLEFLTASGHVTKPNASWLDCGKKYGQNKKASGEILRADPVAQTILCRSDSGQPIFQKFGKKDYILLLDGSCEGNEPSHLRK